MSGCNNAASFVAEPDGPDARAGPPDGRRSWPGATQSGMQAFKYSEDRCVLGVALSWFMNPRWLLPCRRAIGYADPRPSGHSQGFGRLRGERRGLDTYRTWVRIRPTGPSRWHRIC